MASYSNYKKRPFTKKWLHDIAEELSTNSDNTDWSGDEDIGNDDNSYVQSSRLGVWAKL